MHPQENQCCHLIAILSDRHVQNRIQHQNKSDLMSRPELQSFADSFEHLKGYSRPPVVESLESLWER